MAAAMNVNIEITSRQTIKPSSPTPDHLKNYKLSFLDQICPSIYTPSLLFFESNPSIKSSNTEKSNQLKASLSKSLAQFYPLAGRLVNTEFINCNDEGVPYIETSSRSKLSEVIHNPNVIELDKFLPCSVAHFYDNVVLAIQVNFFECGGLAIGTCFLHKIADASSIFIFLNCWAETLRGLRDDHILINKSPVLFESAMLFPPIDHKVFSQTRPVSKDLKERIITKSFVFNNTKLEMLRTMFSTDDKSAECPIRATRIEALTAFLCNRHAIVIKADKLYGVTHAVNIRSSSGKTKSDLSKYHFGNYFIMAKAEISLDEIDGKPRGGFVKKMREAIERIDGKYMDENVRESNKYLKILGEMHGQVAKGEMNGFYFSSWCRMPAYEVDFGWGKPVWFALTSFPSKNIVRFMDNRGGDGIEAWISLKEQDMAKLEEDDEFLSYVIPTA